MINQCVLTVRQASTRAPCLLHALTVMQASFRQLQEVQDVKNVQQARPQGQVPVSVQLVVMLLRNMAFMNVYLIMFKHVLDRVLTYVQQMKASCVALHLLLMNRQTQTSY